MDTRIPRRLRKLRRFRRSITIELFMVMGGLLLFSLFAVLFVSEGFLRQTGAELVSDQDRVAKRIIDESVKALKERGEANLAQRVSDAAEKLDQSFVAVERVVSLQAAAAERLLEHPESARDVVLIESRVFNDPATRPEDFREEKGKNRKVSLGTVVWHRTPGAEPAPARETLRRMRGMGFTMRALYEDHPLSAWIYLGTEDGLYLGYPGDDSIDARYDHRTREWYRKALKAGTTIWSRPYVDPSGKLTITCARPFFSGAAGGNRKVAGVVAVDLTLDQLNALLLELEKEIHGFGFILDAEGRLITSPDADAGGADWEKVFETENLLDEKDPELAVIARRMIADESGVAELPRPEGDKYLAFGHIPSTDWSLGILLPMEQIVGPVRRHESSLQEVFRTGNDHIGTRVDEARSKFLLAGIPSICLLLACTTVFVYVRLTHPIKGFIRDLRVISRGNLDHVVESPTGNELADLANAVNDMTTDLKRSRDQIEEYSRDLERKVEARTAELAASNSDLADVIRRLQEAQSRLVHSEKMASLGQLVAGIAHEINNPVNFIANSVTPLQTALEDLEKVAQLRESGAPDEEVEQLKEEIGFDEAFDQMRRALELIKTGASRTKAIVLQLRNFSRLDEAEMKDADIHEGIDGSLALLNYKLKDRIEVVRDYGQVGRLSCYPGQLNQVFMNILANAIHAIDSARSGNTGEHPIDHRYGTITISTRRDENDVVIRIKDDGPGMPPTVLSKVFDPFFTTKDKNGGTGLGLSISHGIVGKHGGRIEVTSEVGRGSEFVITLPVAVRATSTPTTIRSA